YPTSCTTRTPRPGEEYGDQYYFLDKESFENRIENDAFLEWAQIDGGQYYGTLAEEIIPPLKDGRVVVREVEVQGAKSIRSKLPDENIVIIFIDAGPWEDLEQRIRERQPITEEELAKRRKRAMQEIRFKDEANYIVENKDGQLKEAKQQLEDIVSGIIDN
ncbi:MAG: guanylate kinase, partial [Parcubacteria group bacterium SW_4_46_8]